MGVANKGWGCSAVAVATLAYLCLWLWPLSPVRRISSPGVVVGLSSSITVNKRKFSTLPPLLTVDFVVIVVLSVAGEACLDGVNTGWSH